MVFHDRSDIATIITMLQNRKAKLYHACQLQDFVSYLRLGGIPSRSLLEKNNYSYTKFDSDDKDIKLGTWDKVFLNTSDLGTWFHNSRYEGSLPTIYGPILFLLEPDCLENCSALSINFESGKFETDSSIRDLNEIDEIFVNDKTAPYPSSIKPISQLKQTFSDRLVNSNPELCCELEKYDLGTSKSSFDYIVRIVVDPLLYNGNDLFQIVQNLATNYHPSLGELVEKRKSNYSVLYNQLVENVASLDEGVKSKELSNFLEPAKSWVVDRFSRYLREGTLNQFERNDEFCKVLTKALL